MNVDVLGHLFEKSISELERMRHSGLFAPSQLNDDEPEPAMPKSPERKRFGIYYTPLEFTGHIVQSALGPLVVERWRAVREAHGLGPQVFEAREPSPKVGRFWRDCWNVLRQIKVLDPACGSGAFLIQAYDLLEDRYTTVVEQIQFHEGPKTQTLFDAIPDTILTDNLFGVDLSEQGVEITQLSLWLRSARRGKTLADLSQNIVRGNSLISDPGVHPFALDWKTAFPHVFDRPEGGFDCVVGNPPWERLKLQEREFFAFSAPKIAGAVSAARRRELIAKLEKKNPELFQQYIEAKNDADRTLEYVRDSGRFPLTGKGDVNTYMLFAEQARQLVAPAGRVGLLVPSGIATDNTTREFFGQLTESRALVSLYDFENRLRVFPDVDGRFKFSILVFGGAAHRCEAADFVFFAHAMDELEDKKKHITLTAKDIALLNPNTHTCPIFRSQRDAELTKAIYRRVPVLIDESRKQGGNPWAIRYSRMFDQTNDAELFHTDKQLHELGLRLQGNRWRNGKRTFLPLYEAKMVQAYDHRAASVVLQESNWVRQGQTEATSLVDHQNPEFTVQSRWWVEDTEVDRVLGGPRRPAYLCYKDVTSSTNQRTMIAAFIPPAAVVNSAPLMLTGEAISPRQACCLLANLNSLALDFVARQKVGGVHLNFFIVNQLPIFPPDHYAEKCPWEKRQSLEKWISERVLKLTCTAEDMKPFAEAAGFDPPVHKWRPAEREQLIAELDAAFFLLYGLDHKDISHMLTAFEREANDEAPGMFAQGSTMFEAYERFVQSAGKTAPMTGGGR